MSIEVPTAELGAKLAEFPWGYLLTVDDAQHPRLLAVPTDFAHGVLRVEVGSSSRANATARPEVTMVFPPAAGTEFSLVVDGTAVASGERLLVTPTHAVMHRPALRG